MSQEQFVAVTGPIVLPMDVERHTGHLYIFDLTQPSFTSATFQTESNRIAFLLYNVKPEPTPEESSSDVRIKYEIQISPGAGVMHEAGCVYSIWST